MHGTNTVLLKTIKSLKKKYTVLLQVWSVVSAAVVVIKYIYHYHVLTGYIFFQISMARQMDAVIQLCQSIRAVMLFSENVFLTWTPGFVIKEESL